MLCVEAFKTQKMMRVNSKQTNKSSFFKEPSNLPIINNLILPPPIERGLDLGSI